MENCFLSKRIRTKRREEEKRNRLRKPNLLHRETQR
jgi:hypothetical protein